MSDHKEAEKKIALITYRLRQAQGGKKAPRAEYFRVGLYPESAEC